MNRNVLRYCLKVSEVKHCLMFSGRLFHNLEDEWTNDLSPQVLETLGVTRELEEEERKDLEGV